MKKLVKSPELHQAQNELNAAMKRRRDLDEKLNGITQDMAAKKAALDEAQVDHDQARVDYTLGTDSAELETAKKSVSVTRKKLEKLRDEYLDLEALSEALVKARDEARKQIEAGREEVKSCKSECLRSHALEQKEAVESAVLNAVADCGMNYFMSCGEVSEANARHAVDRLVHIAVRTATEQYRQTLADLS